MQAARNALTTACGSAPSGSFKSLSGTGTVTGVGFFDVIHGQTGVAPNGIELHPVVSFSGSCGSGSPSVTTTVTATSTPTEFVPPNANAHQPKRRPYRRCLQRRHHQFCHWLRRMLASRRCRQLDVQLSSIQRNGWGNPGFDLCSTRM